jgi:hypothetical protein
MQQAAQKSGKTLPEYIYKFQSHGDNDIVLQGDIMKSMMTRYVDLSNAYASLLEATPFSKPIVFLKSFQWNIAQSTFQDFTIGFSVTYEGILYAFIGMLVGYLSFSFCRFVMRRIWRKLSTCDLSRKSV